MYNVYITQLHSYYLVLSPTGERWQTHDAAAVTLVSTNALQLLSWSMIRWLTDRDRIALKYIERWYNHSPYSDMLLTS